MPGSGSNLLHCPSGSQYQVTLGNLANLSCANWTTQTNKVLQAPLFFLDSDLAAATSAAWPSSRGSGRARELSSGQSGHR